MPKRSDKSSNAVAVLPVDYAPLLAEIKARVQSARIKAGLAGFSSLNVWRMRAFYIAYSTGAETLSQAGTESGDEIAPAPPPEPFVALPSGHNFLPLHKLADRAARV